MYKVGITGGIGSGKSTLCAQFQECGIPVYNSDSEAKLLMSNDDSLREKIIDEFGDNSFVDGVLNREYLASIVFNDGECLTKLNSIVHPRVKIAFEEWASAQDAPYVILESAILFEAGFDDCVNASVAVLSPMPLRIERVTSRDGLTTEQVMQRVATQMSDDEIHSRATHSVVNIELDDLNDAARMLDKKFQYELSRA